MICWMGTIGFWTSWLLNVRLFAVAKRPVWAKNSFSRIYPLLYKLSKTIWTRRKGRICIDIGGMLRTDPYIISCYGIFAPMADGNSLFSTDYTLFALRHFWRDSGVPPPPQPLLMSFFGLGQKRLLLTPKNY